MESIQNDSIYELSKEKCTLSRELTTVDVCHRQKRYEQHPHAIRFVFVWMLFAQVLRNYDTGALPVLLGLITDEFGLDEMKLGILGAVPYVSAMATAFIMNHPLQKYSQKWIIVVSLFFLSIGLALLLSSTSSTLLYISRIIMGSMQAPLSIYLPVWIDEFTPPSKLTAWMGASQVTMIIGVAIGYLITGFTMGHHHNGWRFSLLVPCILLFLMSICLMFTNSNYFNVTYLNYEVPDLELEMEKKTFSEGKNLIKISINNSDLNYNPKNISSIPSSCSTELNESPYGSIAVSTKYNTVSNSITNSIPSGEIICNIPMSFDTRIPSKSTEIPAKLKAPKLNKFPAGRFNEKNNNGSSNLQSSFSSHIVSISRSVSLSEITGGLTPCVPLPSSSRIVFVKDPSINMNNDDKPNIEGSRINTFKRLFAINKWKSLGQNSIYILSVIILSVIYYAVTAVQFWTTRYLQEVYSTSDGIIFMSFSATAVIAPTTGIIFSGFIIDLIGGYKTERGLLNTMLFCMGSSTLATLFGVLTLSVDDFIVTIIGIWGLLFFGSFLVPPVTGISVGVVEPNMRQFAATITMVTYHIFGFALGSLLPGAVLQLSGITRSGMTIVYGFSGLGVVANFFACIVAYRKYCKSKEQKVCVVENDLNDSV